MTQQSPLQYGSVRNKREPLFVVVAMLLGCLLLLPVALTQDTSGPAKTDAEKPKAAGEEKPKPLYEQEPFDLIILDEANKNEKLKVLPLFPNRQVPTNRTGNLTVRLVGDDVTEYEVPWKNITNVKLYEEMLLDEGNRLVAEGKLDEAFDYFHHLRNIKPDWPGLQESIDRYLFADARNLAGKEKKRYSESLAVLEELYARRPDFQVSATSTLLDVISNLFDRIVNEYYEKKDFRSARYLLQRMTDKYKANRPASVDKWINQFQQMAGAKRDEARELLKAQKYREALSSMKEMVAIWPTVAGGAELEVEISAAYPLVFVGVTQPAVDFDAQRLDSWPARRTGRLVHRTLVEFLGAGPEGGQYQFAWGTIEHSEDLRRMTLRLNRNAAFSQTPITGHDVARRVLQLADPANPEYNAAWASLLQSVRADVMTVELNLRRPHVLPEAWLRVSLAPKSTADAKSGDGPYRVQKQLETETQFANKTFRPGERLAEIVEQTFTDSQTALAALRRGDIDMIDRVFPADAIRIARESSRDAEIKIVPYAHPTIHLLVANTKNPFLANRDFRRALLLAIDREKILLQEMLGGHEQLGCRVISGPFPASSNEADPLGYAYDETIRPLTFNPLLAKVLSIVTTRQMAQTAKKLGDPEPKLTKLVLGFPGSEIARLGSQAIQAYLKVIGIEVELKEFPPGITDDTSGECDLVYKELAIWEPVTDARRMLGKKGVAPTDSPYVAQSLRWLEESQNWGDIRDRLIDIHRSAYNDVAVLPLWQVVDYLAYHKRVRNVGERPVWLYQNVEQWRIGAEAAPQ